MRNASIRIEKLGAFPCPVSVKIVGPRRYGDAGGVLCIVISHNILLLLILLSPASVDMAESETLSFRCAFILSGHCYSHITMLNSTLFWWPPPPACHPANLCVRSNNYHGTNTVGIRFIHAHINPLTVVLYSISMHWAAVMQNKSCRWAKFWNGKPRSNCRAPVSKFM